MATFIVKNTINQLDEQVKTDVNNIELNKIQQSIMKIVKEHATGKEVKEAIEKIISKQ